MNRGVGSEGNGKLNDRILRSDNGLGRNFGSFCCSRKTLVAMEKRGGSR